MQGGLTLRCPRTPCHSHLRLVLVFVRDLFQIPRFKAVWRGHLATWSDLASLQRLQRRNKLTRRQPMGDGKEWTRTALPRTLSTVDGPMCLSSLSFWVFVTVVFFFFFGLTLLLGKSFLQKLFKTRGILRMEQRD